MTTTGVNIFNISCAENGDSSVNFSSDHLSLSSVVQIVSSCSSDAIRRRICNLTNVDLKKYLFLVNVCCHQLYW
ncbi:hypothetical protein [Candidatus Ichthyocystis sparus]|uniref:hypothetical protein n=1 Tax=Candidatus Ichthyocystis sparus TaxID=1561004 RepID=UPI001F5F4DA3|nr:hypothetical protein [Candidatus Ichthyocystis sparus]